MQRIFFLISHLKNKNERERKSYPKAKKEEKEAYHAGRVKKTNLMAIYESSRIQSSKVKTIPY